MDSIDTASTYGIVGGLVAGAIQLYFRGGNKQDVSTQGYLQYYALWAAMGCLGSSLVYAMSFDTANMRNVGLFGGFVGSYVLLGVGNYG
jgi:hypothetical protein